MQGAQFRWLGCRPVCVSVCVCVCVCECVCAETAPEVTEHTDSPAGDQTEEALVLVTFTTNTSTHTHMHIHTFPRIGLFFNHGVGALQGVLLK